MIRVGALALALILASTVAEGSWCQTFTPGTTVSFPSYFYAHGSAFVGGRLMVGAQQSGQPAHIIVFTDPSGDFTQYIDLMLENDGGHQAIGFGTASEPNTRAYFMATPNILTNLVNVVEVDPRTLVQRTVIHDTTTFPTLQGQGAIVALGNFLYVTAGTTNNGGYSVLAEYRLSDFGLNRQITLSGLARAHVATTDGVSLFLSGDGGWLAKVDPVTLTYTSRLLSEYVSGALTTIGNDVWAGMENFSGEVNRVSKDLSTLTVYYMGVDVSTYATKALLGSVWIGRNDTPGSLIQFHPTSGQSLVRTVTGMNRIGHIQSDNQKYLFLVQTDSTTKMMRVEVTPAPCP